jgi:hypothetical protein
VVELTLQAAVLVALELCDRTVKFVPPRSWILSQNRRYYQANELTRQVLQKNDLKRRGGWSQHWYPSQRSKRLSFPSRYHFLCVKASVSFQVSASSSFRFLFLFVTCHRMQAYQTARHHRLEPLEQLGLSGNSQRLHTFSMAQSV